MEEDTRLDLGSEATISGIFDTVLNTKKHMDANITKLWVSDEHCWGCRGLRKTEVQFSVGSVPMGPVALRDGLVCWTPVAGDEPWCCCFPKSGDVSPRIVVGVTALVNGDIAIEHDHLFSSLLIYTWFFHDKWWFFTIVMLAFQRVT